MSEPSRLPTMRAFEERITAIETLYGQTPLSVGGGGGTSSDMALENRVKTIEERTANLDGQLGWAKIAASLIVGVMLAGFALVAGLVYNYGSRSEAQSSAVAAKIDAITGKIAEELRNQRSDQAAQITAISNAITAAKQQPPQVLLVPAPAPAQPPKQP